MKAILKNFQKKELEAENNYYLWCVFLGTLTFYLLKFPVESPPRKGKNEQDNLNVFGVRMKSVSLHNV